jgi:hypothetical protein
LAQVRAHHGFEHSDWTRARQFASSPSDAPGTNTPNAPPFLEREFSSVTMGSLPASTGRRMRFTGTTILKLENGKIVREIGLDDGVTRLTQLGLLKAA